LKGAVHAAEWRHRLDVVALHARHQQPATDVGAARLRRLLSAYVPVDLTESELEARFLELCARHRIARPERQVWFGEHRADFVWHDVRLIVETDGRRTHGTVMAFRDDRVKDRALRRTGYDVLRFTWGEVVHEDAAVAREIREARARRRRELAGGGVSPGS
jgi:very-short-patch-repair endonuclease